MTGKVNPMLAWSLFGKGWMMRSVEPKVQAHIGEMAISALRKQYGEQSEYFINECDLRLLATGVREDGGSWGRDIYHFKDSVVELAVDALSGVEDVKFYTPQGVSEDKRRAEFSKVLELEGIL